MTDRDTLISFASEIGKLTQGLKTITTNFDRHLKDHAVDRVMQWFIIGLQTIVIVFLGYLKVTGKI